MKINFEKILRLSSLGYEAWKAWRTFNRDRFLIIVKWRKGGKPFHDYQKYIPVKYATLIKPRTLNLTRENFAKWAKTQPISIYQLIYGDNNNNESSLAGRFWSLTFIRKMDFPLIHFILLFDILVFKIACNNWKPIIKNGNSLFRLV